MTAVSVVYHSGSGHTAKMAEAVARGASSIADIQVHHLAIEGKDTVEGRFKNDGSTLHYFFTLAMQHGMLWVGQAETPLNNQGINRLSSYSGVMGQAMTEPPEEAPNAADKLTGEVFGRRVAEAAKRWKRS